MGIFDLDNCCPGAYDAGAHNEGGRENRALYSDIAQNGNVWQHKRQPGGGAREFAYETLGLSPYTPIGAGVAQRTFWGYLAPQAWANLAISTTGLGGVVSGNARMQPLYDPNTKTYGGVK